jgi:hypothetical protein
MAHKQISLKLMCRLSFLNYVINIINLIIQSILENMLSDMIRNEKW